MTDIRPVAAPATGREAAEEFVAEHLRHLVSGPIARSRRFEGGQRAADNALNRFDVTGYASRRNEVYPRERRGASALSPYIRHGLLPLRTVWDAVASGPARDVAKFRDELLWQEYARHWYARLGPATAQGIRRELPTGEASSVDASVDTVSTMACISLVNDELAGDGWLVNQTRMWFASHWTIRTGRAWRDGEDAMFRHLLDGSRAANRLGWQWTTGVGSQKPYGFSRWQVEKRAPGICAACVHNDACPIEAWPDEPDYVDAGPLRTGDANTARFGPDEVICDATPEQVWLTAESLGDEDPALESNPGLPAVFVFDAPLLAGLQLSAKRLVFLTETLAELAETRPVELLVGDPRQALAGRRLAVTHAPVPGFQSRTAAVRPVEVHPWTWLCEPSGGSVNSFSAWRKSIRVP